MPSLANLDSYLGDDDTPAAPEVEWCDACGASGLPPEAVSIGTGPDAGTRTCLACALATESIAAIGVAS